MHIIQPFYIIHAAFVVGRKVNAALLQSAVDGDQTGVASFNSFYGIFLTACGDFIALGQCRDVHSVKKLLIVYFQLQAERAIVLL